MTAVAKKSLGISFIDDKRPIKIFSVRGARDYHYCTMQQMLSLFNELLLCRPDHGIRAKIFEVTITFIYIQVVDVEVVVFSTLQEPLDYS
jgi:hypothetical protein